MRIRMHNLLPLAEQQPEALRPWLHCLNPLTDKLKQQSGSADLLVLNQGWQTPDWWDKYLLELTDNRLFKREIVMLSHQIAYWYAKTIIPQTCYQVHPAFFDRLQSESVRNLIYDSKEVTRTQRIHYPINPLCVEYYWVKKYLPYCAQTLWVRLTELSFMQNHFFYVIEILMPELEQIR